MSHGNLRAGAQSTIRWVDSDEEPHSIGFSLRLLDQAERDSGGLFDQTYAYIRENYWGDISWAAN